MCHIIYSLNFVTYGRTSCIVYKTVHPIMYVSYVFESPIEPFTLTLISCLQECLVKCYWRRAVCRYENATPPVIYYYQLYQLGTGVSTYNNHAHHNPNFAVATCKGTADWKHYILQKVHCIASE